MTKPTLSPERLAELLKRYPDESNAALAAAFGLTTHKVGNLAFNNGVRKSAATRRLRNGPSEGAEPALREIVAAYGALGVNRPEAIAALPQYRAHTVCTALTSLTQTGQLHRAGRPRMYRYFADVAHALAHNTRCQATAAPVVQTRGHRGPAHQAGAAIETAATRRTVCPSPATQAPAAPVSGLFSTLQPGHYLDAEANPWINAITTKGQHA